MKREVSIYRTTNNFKLGEFKGDMEKNEEPSMTVPDMSYSIKEILQKFAQGIGLNVARMPQYPDIEEDIDGEVDYILPDYDLTDLHRDEVAQKERTKLAKESEKGEPNTEKKEDKSEALI